MTWDLSESYMRSLGLVETSLPADSLATDLSAPSKSIPTADEYSKLDRMMGAFQDFLSGQIFAPLMRNLGVELWISSLAASPARTSPALASVPGSTVSDLASGRKWRDASALFDRASYSWRTRQTSLFEDSTESSPTFSRSGIAAYGAYWADVTLAHLTTGTVSGYWPTPTTQDNEFAASMRKWPRHRRFQDDTLAQLHHNRAHPRGPGKKWPTPTASEASRGKACRGKNATGGPSLGEVLGGHQHPSHRDWMMDNPVGWTALEPLETSRFRSWLLSRSEAFIIS